MAKYSHVDLKWMTLRTKKSRLKFILDSFYKSQII